MLRCGHTRVVDLLVGRLPPGLHMWSIVRTSKRPAANVSLMPANRGKLASKRGCDFVRAKCSRADTRQLSSSEHPL
jgi:hypothetical protein